MYLKETNNISYSLIKLSFYLQYDKKKLNWETHIIKMSSIKLMTLTLQSRNSFGSSKLKPPIINFLGWGL